jgi:hypothetical protein
MALTSGLKIDEGLVGQSRQAPDLCNRPRRAKHQVIAVLHDGLPVAYDAPAQFRLSRSIIL